MEDEERRMIPRGLLPPGGGFNVPTTVGGGFTQGIPVGRTPTPIITRPVTGPSFSPNIRYSPLPGAHHGTANPNRQRAGEFSGIPTINRSTGPGQPGPGGISGYGEYRARARALLKRRDDAAYTMHSRRDW